MSTPRNPRHAQRACIQVEPLEGRALLSTIPTADQFNAYDQMNQERLLGLQAINDLRIQNESTVQQLVADGAGQTQGILADLQAGGNRAADLAALRQVRTLMKQGQSIGSRVDHALLSQADQLNRVFTTAHNFLRRGVDPATVEDRGIAALDNVVIRSQTLTDNGGAQIANIDNRILNTGPVTPITPLPPLPPLPPPPGPQFQLTGSTNGTHTVGETSTPYQLNLPTTNFSDNQDVDALISQLIAQTLAQQFPTTNNALPTVTLSGVSTQGNNMTGSYTAQSQTQGGSATDTGTFQVAGSPLDPNFFKHQVFNGQFTGGVVDQGKNGCGGNASLNGNIQVIVDHKSDSVFEPGGTVTVNVTNVVQTPSASLRSSMAIANGICDSFAGNYTGSTNVNSFENPITLTVSGGDNPADIKMTIQLNGSAPGAGQWTFHENVNAGPDDGAGTVSFS